MSGKAFEGLPQMARRLKLEESPSRTSSLKKNLQRFSDLDQHDRKHRHEQLSIECRKAISFIQDSSLRLQQHGAKNHQLKHGIKSMVIQRQNLFERDKPLDTNLTYTVKSIIVSPVPLLLRSEVIEP